MAEVCVLVPELGESVYEARVVRILKSQGDWVQLDDVLVEIETDKITLEVPSPYEGILQELCVQEGLFVNVGQVLVRINTEAKHTEKEDPSRSFLKNNKKNLYNYINSNKIEEGVDVKFFSKMSNQQFLSSENETGRREKMSPLRRAMASRLKEAQNTSAILTTFNEIDMGALVSLRNQYQDEFKKQHGIKMSYMSFFVRALVMALKKVPILNACIDGDDIIFNDSCHVGIAVSTDHGLVVPVLRCADSLSLLEIEHEIASLAEKARAMKLVLSDLSGGTFTISNGGVFGSLLSTPILNPPQSGILGLHKIQDRVVVVNSQMVIRPMMYIALSYDHRIVDGKDAVTFLGFVKQYMEHPALFAFQ